MNLRFYSKKIWQALQRKNLIRILLIIAIIIAISSIGLSLVEPDLSLLDTFWWSIVTLTTVGYGDITPITPVGRLIAIFEMIFGVGILTTFNAIMASILVNQKLRQELGMSSYDFENHIILCEWNLRSRVILKELRLEPQTKEKPIILIANIETKPIDDENLFFIQGQISDETLHRANLIKAETVIILGDDSLDYTTRDAKVVLSTLTIESINPHAYTIVELVDPAHVKTCKRAKADEIIVSSELSSMLLVQEALNHGITKVVADLLSFEDGNQLYKIPLPKSQIGHSFIDVFTYMKQKYQSIVVAVQKGSEGEVICNPPTDYKLENIDYLIVIATEKPHI